MSNEGTLHKQEFAITGSLESLFRDVADWMNSEGDDDNVVLEGISFDSGMGEVSIFYRKYMVSEEIAEVDTEGEVDEESLY